MFGCPFFSKTLHNPPLQYIWTNYTPPLDSINTSFPVPVHLVIGFLDDLLVAALLDGEWLPLFAPELISTSYAIINSLGKIHRTNEWWRDRGGGGFAIPEGDCSAAQSVSHSVGSELLWIYSTSQRLGPRVARWAVTMPGLHIELPVLCVGWDCCTTYYVYLGAVCCQDGSSLSWFIRFTTYVRNWFFVPPQLQLLYLSMI